MIWRRQIRILKYCHLIIPLYTMNNVAQLVLVSLALLVIIIFIGALYAFFYAIFQFIFSAGDPEKIKKARNSIRYMIL